jgi:RimJ/RimL family protein N-acetyltransferase
LTKRIGDNKIDIGIETMPDYRMKGLAESIAYVMIKYCIDNGFEPNWGCNASNIGSIRIAQNLGFELFCSHPMYVSL